MTTKWTIRKYAVSSLGNEVALPWMLFQPGVTPPETFHEAYWAACSMQETFDEMLAYVDSRTHKTRTVEVELPKTCTSGVINHEDLGNDWSVMVSRGNSNAVVRTIHGVVSIHNENLKPLAEYLLALHYEKENE